MAPNGSAANRSSSPAAKAPAKPEEKEKDAAAAKKKAEEKKGEAARQKDFFDQLIELVSVPGLFAILAVCGAAGIQIMGMPESWGLLVCAFAMGLGKGGVPGSSTIASAFFALLAPVGAVNQMMALVTPITMLCDFLVGLAYFNDANWKVAGKMTVWTLVGMVAGYMINGFLSDSLARRSVGFVFLLVILQQVNEKRNKGKKGEAESKEKLAFMQSLYVLIPVGMMGGIASYITNNMGPMLNVYLLALQLDKYTMVGTRAAVFMTINVMKLGLRIYSGDIAYDGLAYGFRLALVALCGVVAAKVWLQRASPEFFRFIYEYVTFGAVSLTGSLLVCGWDLKSLVRFVAEAVKSSMAR